MKNKAVILGANYYISLSLIRCLGRENIHTVAVDYNPKLAYSSKSKYLKEFLIAPHYKKDEKEYLKFLIEYGTRQDVKPVLFPSADPYVEFIDKNLDELKKYYLIAMTEKGLWQRTMDKISLYEMAKKYSFPVPETIDPDDKNFEEKLNSSIGYPCIIKPTDSPSFASKFRVKTFKCNNLNEVKEGLKKSKEKDEKVFVQRIITGFDDHMYTFDFHADQNSNVTHWVTCQKLRQYPINFGASVYTKQKYVQELYDLGAPFIKQIGYKGFGEIEFKKDSKTGKFYLIEINVRTTTLNVLLNKCGVNFPLVAYNELIGLDIGEKSVKEDKEIAFRYLYEDIFAIKHYIKAGQLTKKEVRESLKLKKAPAILDFDDLKPGFSFLGIILKKIKSKLF